MGQRTISEEKKYFINKMKELMDLHEKTLSKKIINIYWEIFQGRGWTLNDYKIAFWAALGECSSMPKPADLIALRKKHWNKE